MTPDDVSRRIASLDRAGLERLHLRIVERQMRAEDERRGMIPSLTWARSFAGRPVDFIGEIIGPEWWADEWVAWRAFVAAAFGLPFRSDDELAIYRECTGRQEPPPKRAREVWVPTGRRAGKSRIAAILAVHLACCHDWSKHLVPGERGVIPVLAEAKLRARQTMDYVKATLAHPNLAWFVERELSEEIEIKGRLLIRVTTASNSAARSNTVLSAVCDEIAFWRTDDDSANPDKEILNALRPGMLTIPGSMLFGLSSPYARKGVLYERYRDYYGRDDERVLVWKAPTERMNPGVDREFIAEEYANDPEAAAAEYGAEFRSDVAAYVSREAVEACVETDVRERPPRGGTTYRAFVDPSGGSADSMTLAVAHAGSDGVGVIDLLREVRPPFAPDSVVSEFAELLNAYGVPSVTGDHYAAEWPRERFAAHGVEYNVADRPKSDIYRDALPLINSRRVSLLDDRRCVNQICSLERKTSRAGRDTIDHPPRGHDDVANAVMGALLLVAGVRKERALWDESMFMGAA